MWKKMVIRTQTEKREYGNIGRGKESQQIYSHESTSHFQTMGSNCD